MNIFWWIFVLLHVPVFGYVMTHPKGRHIQIDTVTRKTYADSATKYYDLQNFENGVNDTLFLKFFNKWKHYQVKVDSMNDIESAIKREERRKFLKKKYKEKLK